MYCRGRASLFACCEIFQKTFEGFANFLPDFSKICGTHFPKRNKKAQQCAAAGEFVKKRRKILHSFAARGIITMD